MPIEAEREEVVRAFAKGDISIKLEIKRKAETYFYLSIAAIAIYLASKFTPEWVRWIAGTVIALWFLAQFQIVSNLVRLRKFYSGYRRDHVSRNHLILGILSLTALGYALLGMWGHWPMPILGLSFAFVVNLLHGVGYQPPARTRDIPQ